MHASGRTEFHTHTHTQKLYERPLQLTSQHILPRDLIPGSKYRWRPRGAGEQDKKRERDRESGERLGTVYPVAPLDNSRVLRPLEGRVEVPSSVSLFFSTRFSVHCLYSKIVRGPETSETVPPHPLTLAPLAPGPLFSRSRKSLSFVMKIACVSLPPFC